MHPGTEDLLSIRDGQPVDAEARAAVDADPALRAEVSRLEATRDRLRELPEFQPPPGVLAKVLAELETVRGTGRATGPATPPEPHRSPEPPRPLSARQSPTASPGAASGSSVKSTAEAASAGTAGSVGTAGSGPRYRLWRQAQWPLRGAIAAAVAVAAILGVRSLDTPGDPPPGAIVAEGHLSTSGTPGFGGASATYTSLTSESARLERMLSEIPYRPRLVNAGTATTISGLEDRIGQVDEVLMYASMNGLQREQAVALWQERVDLMNALVQVRYAEAQRFGY